jgi:RNA polymerase sigma-70 factor (ECF subfamily)
MSAIFLKSDSASSGLLRRARSDDPDAWRRLCEMYGPLVYRWARQAGLQASDAADLGQEVFQVVATRLNTFHRQSPQDSFTAWVRGITRNKLREFFRRRTVGGVGYGGTDGLRQLQELTRALSADSSSRATSERGQLVKTVMISVKGHFEPTTWTAFWRTAVEGRPTQEVAAQLGLSASGVRQARCRVLRRLRQELDELV